jgi:phosphoglycerol transferase MdoB-like AlkP superfamily enzyme
MDRDEKPHVILLFLESFSSHAIGYEKKATPHFDKLSQEGIVFSNFYSNRDVYISSFARRTLWHSRGRDDIRTRSLCEGSFCRLPQLMKQAGYTTAFFHNGSLSFDRQRDFLQNHFDLLADRNEIEESPHTSTSWGAHDEWLMRYHCRVARKTTKAGVYDLVHHFQSPSLDHT